MSIYECEICGNEYCAQTMNNCNGKDDHDCNCDDINTCQAKCMLYCFPKCNFCSVECKNDKSLIKQKIVELQEKIKSLRKLLKNGKST